MGLFLIFIYDLVHKSGMDISKLLPGFLRPSKPEKKPGLSLFFDDDDFKIYIDDDKGPQIKAPKWVKRYFKEYIRPIAGAIITTIAGALKESISNLWSRWSRTKRDEPYNHQYPKTDQEWRKREIDRKLKEDLENQSNELDE